MCWWCSCGRDPAPHLHKPQSTISTCLPLAQEQALATPQWTHQPWAHTHSGMSVTAMMETPKIASACEGKMAGRQAVPMAMQALLVACRRLGGSPCLLCTPSGGPCLQVVSCILAWAQAGPPSLAGHCALGCKHSPSRSVQLPCVSIHKQTRWCLLAQACVSDSDENSLCFRCFGLCLGLMSNLPHYAALVPKLRLTYCYAT